MPPQSRGGLGEEQDSSPSVQPGLPPPRTRPHLQRVPSPTILIPDQPTPTLQHTSPRIIPGSLTSPELQGKSKDDFTLGDDDEESSIGEDEEEFQSHYSRNSPASTTEDEDDEDDADQDNDFNPSSTETIRTHSDRLQRVASLPVSNPQRPPLPHSHSTASLRPPPPLPPVPPPLYPPFYNRPPTPLPPSPSLTSLLRPPSILNRSTTSTRPTTPDSSDVETPLDTEAAVAHSARRATPLPPTSPKVPTYEYYGFVLYLASTLSFIIYLLWSYLPSFFLHALGVTYYPNRWWSLAIPSWIVMLLVFIYVALTSYNVEYLTLKMESLECIVDDTANIAILDEHGRIRRGGSKRLVAEFEERKKLRRGKAKALNSWSKSSTGTGSGRAKKKHKDGSRRRKQHASSSPDKQHSQFPLEPLDSDSEDLNWLAYIAQYGPTEHGARSGNKDFLAWKQIWNQGTDAVMDVPIGGVCQVLYGGED